MKWLKTVFVVLVVAVCVLVLGRNLVAKAAVSGGIKMIAGLDARIGSMQGGLLKSAVGIKELQVLDPAGFQEPVMVDIPELYVDYDLGSFLRGKVHLETLRLHLKQFNVVKNGQGQLNLHAIKALETGKAQQPPAQKPGGPAPALQIDVLELNIGKVVFKDYTKSPVLVKEFNVNIDERYEHIANPYAFAGLVVSRALIKTTVGQLANFDVMGLQSTVTQALKEGAGKLTGTLTQGAEQAAGAATNVVGGATGTAKEVVDQTSGRLKKLFGQ